MNFNDTSFFLGVSGVTVLKIVKEKGWKVIEQGTQKLIERKVVEEYKKYMDSTYTRHQIQEELKKQGINISLRSLYTKLRENRRYTVSEVRDRLGLQI